jgi:hypothetical protein
LGDEVEEALRRNVAAQRGLAVDGGRRVDGEPSAPHVLHGVRSVSKGGVIFRAP